MDEESLMGRILIGIIAGALSGVSVVIFLAWNFSDLNTGLADAETMEAYLLKLWYVPAGIAGFTFLIGLWQGSRAMKYARELWELSWW